MFSPKIPKVPREKISKLKEHIEKTLNLSPLINESLLIFLVQMSYLVTDRRLKHIFLEPFAFSQFKKDGLSEQIELIKKQLQKVIKLSKDIEKGFNKDQLHSLNRQIELAIIVAKSLEHTRAKLNWIIAPDISKQLEKIKHFLEEKEPSIKHSNFKR